ncbi:hypothetical protein HanOQP8_Chr10g0382521 [Helianthus annuus]|nr:hypothetical protein HanOQP8_Chr10g0382521 [Helianthus annuus]
MDKRKQGNNKEETSTYMDMKSTRMELKSISKDIEYMGNNFISLCLMISLRKVMFIDYYYHLILFAYVYLGPSHMTWKQKKALEKKKVVSLGGKVRFIYKQVGV